MSKERMRVKVCLGRLLKYRRRSGFLLVCTATCFFSSRDRS